MAYTTINKSTDYFNTVTYTGDGTSSRDITGVGFKPDWVWIKCRSNAENHNFTDSVRGATKTLEPNNNVAEATYSTVVSAFISDGFTVGNSDYVNGNTRTYASWNWYTGATPSSNTDGTITSNVSVNSTSGFSIVTYTGTGSTASVGHGLGSKPDLIISKNRSTGDWNVYHDSFALNERIKINSTGAKNTNTSIFSSLPTSSIVNIGNGGDINTSGGNHLFYCFKNIKGFSKIGSYTGNGNSNGTFVYTGFKPAFILAKRTDVVDNWIMYDNKRSGYNPQNDRLYPNGNFAEEGTTDKMFDMLSNGFKARATWTTINASGGTYIYMAFGQTLVGSNNVPCTAR